jgi:hypothetical protein
VNPGLPQNCFLYYIKVQAIVRFDSPPQAQDASLDFILYWSHGTNGDGDFNEIMESYVPGANPWRTYPGIQINNSEPIWGAIYTPNRPATNADWNGWFAWEFYYSETDKGQPLDTNNVIWMP